MEIPLKKPRLEGNTLEEVKTSGKLADFNYIITTEDEKSYKVTDLRCHINMLNDDCLLLIFALIPEPKRLPLAQVCRRWRELNLWLWKSLRCLDFTDDRMGQFDLNDQTIKFVRHCPNITSLNLAKVENHLTPEAIDIVAISCKHLENLCMIIQPNLQDPLRRLIIACPNLKNFEFKNTDNEDYNDIYISCINNCLNLSSLSIWSNHSSSFWLTKLHAPLHTLIIDIAYVDEELFFKGIYGIKDTLRSLQMFRYGYYEFNIEKLVHICPDLTTLTFCFTWEPRGVLSITRLSKLEILSLSGNWKINDLFILSLVKGCPALKEILLVSNAFIANMTDHGLSFLAKLLELTYLSLPNLQFVTDKFLTKFSKHLKLKYLEIPHCSNVTDFGCAEMIDNCRPLEVLDVSYCKHVTNKIISNNIHRASRCRKVIIKGLK